MFFTTTLSMVLATGPAALSPTGESSVFNALRARCINVATVKQCEHRPSLGQIALTSPTGWKFARSKAPAETGEVTAITKTADIQQSDPDFAGLMIRCTTQQRSIEVLLVLITPLPPRSRPQVTIDSKAAPRAFEGRMAAGGAAVILPDDAAALAAGPWQSMQRLQIAVKDGDTVIRGSVALDGLGQAYSNLVNNCGQ